MIYIDNYKGKYKNLILSHMWSESQKELDEFAKKLGLKKEWKHNDHYDISQSKKILAKKLGAIEIDVRDLALKRTIYQGVKNEKARKNIL